MQYMAHPNPTESANIISVQVCYAPPAPAAPVQILLDVDSGMTIGEALALPIVKKMLEGFDAAQCRVGIWGKIKSLDAVLNQQDRIEVYRPLIADPKEARHRRAARNQRSKV
jgi:putative ubiquitin-RnfH superfamily antitoxin RatB of RatAB toxin-antitoxin module